MTADERRDEWGRVPGLRPPLPPAAPLLWVALLSLVLTAVVIALVRPPGPLDQPDPAYQRDGLLLSGPRVPAQVAGVRFGGQPVVLLFDRRHRAADELRVWLAAVPQRAQVYLAGPPPLDGAVPRLLPVPGPWGDLAAAVRLPDAVDGLPGIGYAVVDSDRTVRYATLDPAYLGNGFELATIVGAIR